MLDQSFAKWSVCALYHRMFGMNRQYALWIYVHVAVQAITYTALVILQLLQCRPLNKFWQWWTPGECFPVSTVIVAVEPPNSIIDFTMVLLALFMIRDLQVKIETKWMLRLLCGIGSLLVTSHSSFCRTPFLLPLRTSKLTPDIEQEYSGF